MKLVDGNLQVDNLPVEVPLKGGVHPVAKRRDVAGAIVPVATKVQLVDDHRVAASGEKQQLVGRLGHITAASPHQIPGANLEPVLLAEILVPARTPNALHAIKIVIPMPRLHLTAIERARKILVKPCQPLHDRLGHRTIFTITIFRQRQIVKADKQTRQPGSGHRTGGVRRGRLLANVIAPPAITPLVGHPVFPLHFPEAARRLAGDFLQHPSPQHAILARRVVYRPMAHDRVGPPTPGMVRCFRRRVYQTHSIILQILLEAPLRVSFYALPPRTAPQA